MNYSTKLSILPALTLWLTTAEAQHWDFGYGKDANGYTILRPSSDSLIIYVSNRTGAVNSPNCRVTPTQAGSDVFRPTGTITPCRDIEYAKGLLEEPARRGKPDYLLFRRGDTWQNFPGFFEFTRGRSRQEPVVIGSYAPASDTSSDATKRPLFVHDFNEGVALMLKPQEFDITNIAVIDLHLFLNVTSETPWSTFGVLMNSNAPYGVSNVLVENIKTERFFAGTRVTAEPDNIRPQNVALRRNVYVDGLIFDDQGGGISGDGDNILVEDNWFDRNGHRSLTGSLENTTFRSHAWYFEMSPGDVTNSHLIGNLATRNADGGKFGSLNGGMIKGNAIIQGAIGIIQCCNAGQVIEENVFTETFDYNATNPGGMGLLVGGQDFAVRKNLFAHASGGRYRVAMSFHPDTERLQIENNVVTNWCGPDGAYAVQFDAINAQGMEIHNNTFDQTCQVSGERAAGFWNDPGTMRGPGYNYSGNRYYVANQSQLHRELSQWLSFATWLNEEPTATFGQASFPQRQTDTATFVTHLCQLGAIPAPCSYNYRDLTAIDRLGIEMRKQSKWTYNPRVTASYYNNYMFAAFGMGPSVPALPEVRIEVVDALASEANASADKGKIRIHRTGSTTSAITVSLTRAGSATNNVDYVSIALTKQIPSGATFADIDVTAIVDSAVEGTENVRLQIAQNAAYTINSSAAFGNVVIRDANSCLADIDLNGKLNANDYMKFMSLYAQGSFRADLDLNGQVNSADFTAMINAYANGCP